MSAMDGRAPAPAPIAVPMPVADGWSRRDALRAATLASMVFGPMAGAALWTTPSIDKTPTARHRAMMRRVAHYVIPRTSTAGAGDVGVGDFVLLALAHGLANSTSPVATQTPGVDAPGVATLDGRINYARWLERTLDGATGANWLDAAPQRQLAALQQVDQSAFPPGPPPAAPSPWQTIKTLILTGYYTSQIGAEQELRYELVPGRYDADVPATPQDRAFSSDWTAVEFG
ncbi:MAG: gluconate 2-dehydrogenase subunit 3 family protein [Sphingopyxis sp.]